MMYSAHIAWHRKHFLWHSWSYAWRDPCIQVAAAVMVATIIAASMMPSSDMITILGGAAVAVLAGVAGALKASAPILEMYFKHKENMARLKANRSGSQVPDSSEVEENGAAKAPVPKDHEKVNRVRRRREKKPKQLPPPAPTDEVPP